MALPGLTCAQFQRSKNPIKSDEKAFHVNFGEIGSNQFGGAL
jgi:hypothetical protein